MGNPEPNPALRKQGKVQLRKRREKWIGAETQWKLF